ncbi:hypothetical protein HYX05_02740 [Candidatus Woesearchaeota archaeon]|nr:hypothetical protein [Candidatus Woesearchaeota archaeon]
MGQEGKIMLKIPDWLSKTIYSTKGAINIVVYFVVAVGTILLVLWWFGILGNNSSGRQ